MAIRILHVIPSLGRGGAERELVDIVSNTARGEFEHTVCFFSPPADFAVDIEKAGHKTLCLNLTGKWPWISGARKIRSLFAAHKPNIIHSWTYNADISTRLTQFAGRRIPLITSLGIAPFEPEAIRAANVSNIKMNLLRWVDLLSAKWAKPIFVACSHFVRQSTIRHLGVSPSDVQVIYNSVDPETLRSEPGAARALRHSLDIPGDAFVYLSIGRLDLQKGQAVLLRAFRDVAAGQAKSFLAIVGTGPLEDSLRALADELKIGARVRFLGRRQDIGTCLEMADVFVFPSLFEGFGIALAEALIKGLPSIATRCTAIPEVVRDGDTGILVSPGSVKELAAAMTRLYEDQPLRTATAARGAEDARARFLSQVLIPEWESLYRRVASGEEDRVWR